MKVPQPDHPREQDGPIRRGSRYHRVAPLLNRRQFLQELAETTGAAASVGVLAWLAYSDEPVRVRDNGEYTLFGFPIITSALKASHRRRNVG
ncbi:hypothetical protein CCP3SC15_3070003 [Gammaproteobacteria bacterium]